MMKFANPSIFFFMIILLLACEEQNEEAATRIQKTEGPVKAIPVTGFVVTPQTLEKVINATGSLIPYESVEIRSERAGKLIALNFKEASFVNKGQTLGRIDDTDLQAQKARLLINLDLAEKEVARGEELIKIQGISKEEMDRLVNQVADTKAEIDIIDVQIKKSIIKTPFSGVLGLRLISQGAYITPADPIVTLQQLNPIKLEFDVPEKFLSAVKKGQEVTFTVVGSTKQFIGHVYAIDPAISPVTRTFKVRANANNQPNILKPGQFAKVTLITGTDKNAMIIPTDAVIPVLDGKQVFVAKQGKAMASAIETGDRKSSHIEITKGLSIGDTIIVSGLLAITDGTLININQLTPSQTIEE